MYFFHLSTHVFSKFVKKLLNWPAFAPIKSGGGINLFDGRKFFHYLLIGSCILRYHLGLTFDGQHFGALGFCQSIYPYTPAVMPRTPPAMRRAPPAAARITRHAARSCSIRKQPCNDLTPGFPSSATNARNDEAGLIALLSAVPFQDAKHEQQGVASVDRLERRLVSTL